MKQINLEIGENHQKEEYIIDLNDEELLIPLGGVFANLSGKKINVEIEINDDNTILNFKIFTEKGTIIFFVKIIEEDIKSLISKIKKQIKEKVFFPYGINNIIFSTNENIDNLLKPKKAS